MAAPSLVSLTWLALIQSSYEETLTGLLKFVEDNDAEIDAAQEGRH